MARSLTGPGNIAKLGDTMLGPFNEAQAPDVPSSTSVNLIVTKGNLVDITGTTTILSINLAPGAERVIRFTGSLRLTHSASMVLPGGEDIITTPNDMAIVRGYQGGVVRFVTYSRATGYVQRVGDKLLGTLTFAPGAGASPPVKFQAGSLTTLKVPHACEWDGSNFYMTNTDSVRKQLMYTDGNGSSLTNFSSKQITDALGYTPFDPNSSPNTISPKGGLLEAGRYVDMHSGVGSNDFDVRLESSNPTGGSGTSDLHVTASNVYITGSKVWNAGNLTNLNQLTNGPGYAPSANPVFTGRILAPQGSGATPGIIFGGEAADDTGFYGPGDGLIGVACNGVPVADFTNGGLTLSSSGGSIGGFTWTKTSASPAMNGNFRIDFTGNKIRFYDTGAGNRGATLEIPNCNTGIGSQILTSDMIPYAMGASGYQRLPSGMIMQWGKKSSNGISSNYITFYISFPNACTGFFTSYDMTNNRGEYRSGGSVSNSGAYVSTDNADTWWFAIGY